MSGANNNRIEVSTASAVLLQLCAYLLLCSGLFPSAHSAADDELDQWWLSDWEQQAEQVNEGELKRLPGPLPEPVHEHINHIRISPQSLQTGWVELQQCHHNLDAVAALQITFVQGRVRKLAISSKHNIGAAWVQGDSVQLQDISAGSRLCLTAETRALRQVDNKLLLVNGPYMRRFLDGFYPMHVQLRVDYPVGLLRYETSSPVAFQMRGAGRLELDVWFEGELYTRVEFSRSATQ
jgi:hypothetical protein